MGIPRVIGKQMGRKGAILSIVLTAPIVLGVVLSQFVRVPSSGTPAGSAFTSKGESGIPPYHPAPPKGLLPATLRPEQFGDPVVRNCYALAATIKKTLYQLPCYCPCWRTEGHKSLLDCYRTTHASICDGCQQEALYAYLQQRKGLSVAEIRAGIEKGEWKEIDLTQFRSPDASRLPATGK